jgi:hypothetical protein
LPLNLVQQLQGQIVQTRTALAELWPGDPGDGSTPSIPHLHLHQSASTPASNTASAPAQEKKKTTKRKRKVSKQPLPSAIEDAPLSLEEQKLLTETIDGLSEEHHDGVIQIIREAAPVGADEDEIDLYIDQLDTRTQRKLLKHVSKVKLLSLTFILIIWNIPV